MNQSYKGIAPYYDSFMSFMDYDERVAALDFYLKEVGIIDATMLELGVGSGSYLIPLRKRGYLVDGLDLSSDMLLFLKEKLLKSNIGARLYEGDMSSFDIDHKYATIFCLGDSIHHLPSYEGINGMLGSVKAHLKDGGRFLVDYREPEYFEQLVDIGEFYENHGDNYLLWSSEFVSDEQVHTKLNAFICGDDNRFDKISEIHEMLVLDHDDLLKSFDESGYEVCDELFGSFWAEDDSSEYKHTFVLKLK